MGAHAGLWLLAVAFWGCDDGGGGGGGDAGPGGGGGALTPIEGPAETVGFAATYDRMGRVASVDGFANANIGDPAPYVNSEATTPTDDQALSSLYYETGGFADAIGRTRDRRPGVDKDDNVGDRIQQKVALALTLGFAAEGAASVRNGARWHAQLATRALDQYFLLAAWAGLAERSAAGFDRAVGVLWDASGAPTASAPASRPPTPPAAPPTWPTSRRRWPPCALPSPPSSKRAGCRIRWAGSSSPRGPCPPTTPPAMWSRASRPASGSP
ncbi:MAG: hypothetical protein R3F43_06570 [bacterium]